MYTFVRLFYKCTSREAIEMLKQYAGYDGKVSDFSRAEKLSATISCKKFMPDKQKQKESKTTKLPDDYMDRYEDRPEKLSSWREEGISDESLKKFCVKYDSFSDRIVYPIRDPDGIIVNIGGRTLDPDWKEKKLRKYCYFYPWGTMQTIYGYAENLKAILDKHEIILFEGAKSVMIADSWGIKNCGAILTSHVNPNQMKLLAKLGCDVVFALDKDVRVRDDHNIKILKDYVNVYYIYDYEDLLNDKDSPVDQGEDVFNKLYERRLRYR